MAKSKDPGALTLNGMDFVFLNRHVKISDLAERASRGTADAEPNLELERMAKRVPRAAWLLLLGADAGVTAAQIAGDPKAMGPALVAALRGLAAKATLDECHEAARAAGEAARLLLTPRYAGARGADPTRRAKLRAALARPVTVDSTDRGARLTGGPFGQGVTMSAIDQCRLAWAALSWTLALAAHAPPPSKREGSVSGRSEPEAVIVTIDGVDVAAERLEAGELGALFARAEAGEAMEPVTNAAAFEATATRQRDEGQRLACEVDDLEEITSVEYLPDMSAEDRAHARRLAGELRHGSASDPRLHAIRERVREALAPPTHGPGSRSIQYVSDATRRMAWVKALAADARGAAELEADAAEGAIIDTWTASPPGACGVLLAPGMPHPEDPWYAAEDPWLAEVTRTAAAAELDALDALLTRPGPRARAAIARRAALPDRPRLEVEVMGRVADARDSMFGLRPGGHGGTLRRRDAEALLAALWSGLRELPDLGPGVVAVLVRLPVLEDAWRVVVGRLPAVLAAGYVEITAGPSGLPVATVAQSGSGDDIEDLHPAAVAWAIEQWRAGGYEGDPPTLPDAVRAALAAAAAPRPKRPRR